MPPSLTLNVQKVETYMLNISTIYMDRCHWPPHTIQKLTARRRKRIFEQRKRRESVSPCTYINGESERSIVSEPQQSAYRIKQRVCHNESFFGCSSRRTSQTQGYVFLLEYSRRIRTQMKFYHLSSRGVILSIFILWCNIIYACCNINKFIALRGCVTITLKTFHLLNQSRINGILHFNFSEVLQVTLTTMGTF